MSHIALVAGGTGLIGNQLIRLLEMHERYQKIVVLTRGTHPPEWEDVEKIELLHTDFSDLGHQLADCSADHIYCALGSTTRKTPDKQRYFEIDVEYPVAIAQQCLQNGARSFNVVSAHGANPRAVNFYMKMKGEMEKRLAALNYPVLNIARPGILLGMRNESRPAERVGQILAKYLPGNYKAILGQDVAAALITAANSTSQGMHILSSAEMQGAAHHLINQLQRSVAECS